MKRLLQHADILCGGNDWTPLKNAYLAIENDRILSIGLERPQGEFDQIMDMSGCLLLPGLYNMHTHTPMSLLRGLGSGLPLDKWLFEKMLPIESRMTKADASVGARIAMMEMLASGVVSFSDMYHHPSNYADDVLSSGMKANLGYPIMAVPGEDQSVHEAKVQESFDFFDRYNNAGSGRLLANFAIHAEYTSTVDSVQEFSQICKDHHTQMQIHLSETIKEHEECKQRHGKTPARFFYDLGVFDNPTIAAHCVVVEAEDIDLLKEKDVTVVHNPSSNMKLGSGFMPMKAMLERGIRVTLGTDGDASNNNQNLLEEMHLAALIHCGYTKDPTLLRTSDLLSMATCNGAAGQGRPDCGSLAAGMKADLIAINLDAPHLMPDHDSASLLVYAAQASDVVMTMVDGCVLYDHGEFLTIDRERVRYDLQQTLGSLF